MPLYRMMNPNRQLEVFRPTEFGSHYLEKDLESWLEDNPHVLVADEPLLMIGRQVNTPVGTIDLLALDADGVAVIIELKRAPDQRGAIAQALEYAAWLSIQGSEDIQSLAESYLGRKKVGLNFDQVWLDTFNSDSRAIALNQAQRICLVIEGRQERIIAVAKYLRRAGVDISLLSYSYYRTENNEELLQIESQVGDPESFAIGPHIRQLSSSLSESNLLNSWGEAVAQAYLIFKERMVQHGLVPELRRSQISFQKPTSDGKVFICGYHGSGINFKLWLRSDTLQSRFDFQSAVQRIEERTQPVGKPKLTSTWYLLTFVATVEAAAKVAEVIISEVADRIS